MSSSKKPAMFRLSLLLPVFIGFSFSTVTHADVLSTSVAADIQEPAGTYDTGAPTLLNLYAKTVLEEGVCLPDEYDGCTFNDVLNDIDPSDDFKPEVKVHITGDGYPDDGLLTNGAIRQRGGFSRAAPQKSFRIKLDKDIPLWRGERRIQLNKSFYDLSRIRNKITFDLLVDVPNLPSMRTQFVNLTLEDQGVTDNLGVFTQLEYFGKEYLERRGWDKDSRVYKTEYFFFQESPDYALDGEGEPVDIDAFEKLIEIKRGDTHNELISFIDDVNNPNLNFQTDIFNKYLNQDNYLSWFALNILTDNADTVGKNHYYYNPIDTEKFYLVPWDYDLGWESSTQADDVGPTDRPRWWYSHAYAWPNKLHRRFLQTSGNLALLKSAVIEFKQKHLTQAKIAAKRDSYYDVIFPTISTSVDWDYIYFFGSDPEKVAQFNQMFESLSSSVERNFNRFLERENDPMPFYTNTPSIGEDSILFSWEESESLTGQTISYDLELATTPEFTPGTVVEVITGISQLSYRLDWGHPAGTYYSRLTARDSANPQNSWMTSLDSSIQLSNYESAHGVRALYVNIDGTDPEPPVDGVSNPIVETSIILDGNTTDWNGLVAFPNDPNDINNNAQNVIDWKNVKIAHSDDNVYFLYENYGAINTDGSTYIPWGWQVYIDSDNNPDTGFKYSAVVGADYIIEGSYVQRYSGTGTNWSWDTVGRVSAEMTNNIREFSFPRSWLGSSSGMNLVFQGANVSYGGNTTDLYPDGALTQSATVRSWKYAFGTVTPPTNEAPVATGQSLSLLENTTVTISLNATDADQDSLSLVITKQPEHGTLTSNPNSLIVSYIPDTNYQGSDSFSFKVNDGQVDSNTATVNLEVVPQQTNEGISNPVIAGGISIDGNDSDWSSLEFFSADPADVSINNSNPIDWLSAGMAHSADTVYLTYKNAGPVNPGANSGSSVSWGWQTFIDGNRDPQSGYLLNDNIGAEYLVEGRYVYQYAGTNGSWEWIQLGVAQLRYVNNTVELSFPRNWLSQLNNINVAFYGNNTAAGGSQYDTYPDQGALSYSFGGTGEFGEQVQVAEAQRQSSPVSHQPVMAATTTPTDTGSSTDTPTTTPPATSSGSSSSGGGSFSWMLLFASALFIRRRIGLTVK
ncbi:CotH kinase family protein [Cocleimonas sp. KMM 6892]|uniref:CotH kinase family protein n=1 Tax=unclassified Cocleimonas TaxID=2639732 RepID=UPI002DBEB9B3|nr:MULTISPECIES: CotH kinase family protein [unclassified Cocleimonas]MEB8433421.1 CotH kinase family protein [Cocleimonas sp. KMM 6892]MEC4716232.1 CotH kinase family protein [Cocleimonas sp. KMM 6895]MEC4745875.1 CotH kinase family protein [Cocleimonas sp. KMM 6896]